MHCGTWNIQGLGNKRELIAKDMESLKMQVVALTETKKKGSGSEVMGEFIHIYSGVPKDQRAKRGVSLLIRKNLKKYITDWESIDENLIRVNLNWMQKKITIVGIYAPSNDEPVNEKDKFFTKLNDLIDGIGNSREILLLGDFNSRTGKRTNSKIVGPYGEDQINDNGERLIDICEYNNLKITNGFFKHKEIHKYTWIQPTRHLKSIIDYVITRQSAKIRINNVRVLRGTTCDSDHQLVRATIFFPYEHNETQQTDEGNVDRIQNAKYKLDNLTHDSVIYLYQKRLDEKLVEDEDQPFEEMYNNIIESIHKAAKEAIGINDKIKSKNLWWNDEIDTLVQEKKTLYLKWMSSKAEEDRLKYISKKNDVRRIIKSEKNRMWDKKCQEIKTYIGGRRNTEVWKFIKNNTTDKREKVSIQIIQQQEWIKHYSSLLTENRNEYNVTPDSHINIQGEQVTVTIDTIKKAVKGLKNNRAPGPEGVHAELIKYGTEKLYRMITTIINRCLNGHPCPNQWKLAYISSIHKKGSKKDPNNYRGISVTSTMSRLYGRILRDLIETEYSSYEEEEQSGFRAGRSCMDNVFCLKQIIEKKTGKNQEVHMVFIDLQKAYDTVPISKLWEVLQGSNINYTLIKALQNLYEGSKSRLKINNSLSPEFSVTKGLRQGCCVSPTLFKIYIAKALHMWKQKCHGMGIELNDGCLYTLQFADDQVVIANDKEDAEYMVRKLVEEYDRWGLKVNTEKTKYLCIGSEETNLMLDNNQEITTCEEYKYLGVTLNSKGTDDQEINVRVIQARRAIRCLNGILWSKEITKKQKYNIYETMIKSTLTYGCETWRLTERNRKKVEATEMDAMRRTMRISRMDRIRNDEIRQRMGTDGTITDDIQRKQLIWYGHVQRMGNHRIPKQILEWTPRGTRKRGRPKRTWMEGIRKAMSAKNLTDDQWNDRQEWKIGIGQRRKTF